MKEYDVIIIGSGGGSKITRPAAKLGNKVAVIEKTKLGGTCLNRGCIPSKMLIHVADVATTIHQAERFEMELKAHPDLLFEKLVERVNSTIDRESDSIHGLYAEYENIDTYMHGARFVGEKQVSVNGEVLTAPKIFIAVGASPKIPSQIEGIENVPYMTYTEALRNKQKPKKLTVIGAGYIASELGYFFGALGTEVTFLVRSSFLRNEDEDIQQEFQRVFEQQFAIRYDANPKKALYQDGVFTIEYQREGRAETIDSDALLLATGILPNTDSLDLEKTGIKTDRLGFIQVNDQLETTCPGIWSFGDCIGRHFYRHTANFEGEYLFEQVFKETPEPIDYPPVPHAVFTNPQIGAVGKTEQELIDEGVDYVVGLNKYADSAMGMALRSEEGFCKLLFHKQSKKLLGAHIVGDEASDMIHMLIAYMNMGATLDDILRTIFIHPALPEIVRNSARKARDQFD